MSFTAHAAVFAVALAVVTLYMARSCLTGQLDVIFLYDVHEGEGRDTR